MGKNQHSKDRLFITSKEWSEQYGGHKDKKSAKYRRLPFDCCALSMTPFEHPVMTPDGFCFDISQIVPYIRKHRTHPVTGAALTGKDLVTLHFHKNTDGQYACPITGKVFSENTRIIALRTTGNVFSYEAFETLCIKAKNLRDLITDEPCKKDDVVFIQDPSDPQWLQAHDIGSFAHMRGEAAAAAGGAGAIATSGGTAAASAGTSGPGPTAPSSSSSSSSSSSAAPVAPPAPKPAGGASLAAASKAAAADPSMLATKGAGGGYIRTDDTTRRILAAVADAESERLKAAGSGSEGSVTGGIAGVKRPRSEMGGSSGSGTGTGSDGAAAEHITAPGVKTTGQFAASFTSTGMSVRTRNEAAVETEQDRLEKRWAGVKALKRKGLVRFVTTHGNLNIELHCDLVPRTCDNFLSLAKRGYYNGVGFHRLIRNFMIQGGDPTGTGRGGQSTWGSPFADEFHPRLSHSERGILSMANSGPDTNKSQFFITFKSAPHLDKKHSVFGRVVGGLDVLREMETVPVDGSDRPKAEVAIREVIVFQDPYAEWEQHQKDAAAAQADAAAARAREAALAKQRSEGTFETWLSDPTATAAAARGGSGASASASAGASARGHGSALLAALSGLGDGAAGSGTGRASSSAPTVGKYLPPAGSGASASTAASSSSSSSSSFSAAGTGTGTGAALGAGPSAAALAASAAAASGALHALASGSGALAPAAKRSAPSSFSAAFDSW